jgi:AraC family transcriptional regulator of adaptative response / DNA-3-methyladenine glycosylase II
MRLIADGVVDREGVPGLARRLGYSERHLNRLLIAEVGASPLALARAQRAQTARVLLETTQLRAAEIAFAAGFSSVRQFNETVQEVFALAPMALRARAIARRGTRDASWAAPGTVALRLAYRSPLQTAPLFGFLAARAIPGVEEGDQEHYRRTLSLPRGTGVAEVSVDAAGEGYLRCLLALEDLRDLTAAVRRLRRLFDLDADPVAVVRALGADPVLGASVAALPGLRTPGHVDGDELAFRAVLGQQVSVAGARTIAGRLASEHGRKLGGASGSLTCLFPDATVIAALAPGQLPMPAGRAQAVIRLASALASGEVILDAGADRDAVAERLLAIPGIGPWTVAYVRLRALGDPDAFLPSDLGVRRALKALGLPGDPRSAASMAEAWRPWRSYALHYLWSAPKLGPGQDRPSKDGRKGASSMTPIANKAAVGSGVTGSGAGSDPETIWTSCRTPIGDVLLVADDSGLLELHLPGSFAVRDEAPTASACVPLARAVEQLDAYFAGELTEFDLPLSPKGTAFQLKVWRALADIPYAETESYGSVAARIGNPKASRAVGMANNKNPLAIVLPCHRVIGSNGSLVGYGGGLWMKDWLLQHEAKVAERQGSTSD